MPGLDWLILGVIVVVILMGWALSTDIAKAHSTLIALNQTLTALEGDVAAIRDRVAPAVGDEYDEHL